MFRAANAIANQFTRPVIMSRRHANGYCAAGGGAFVVINDEGWIATAFHVVKQFSDMVTLVEETAVREQQRVVVEACTDLQPKEKRRLLNKLKPQPDGLDRCSAWWGIGDGLSRLTRIAGVEPADFAVGKLEPFDPSWITTYPTFKDPSRDFQPGTMLCKLGYPFSTVQSRWDDESQSFRLDLDGHLALFPLEGMFTRTAALAVEGPTPPYPLFWVETSSPGIPGQSGGPTFDTHGTVWAIQVQTSCYPLGFEPVPPGRNATKVHQFLNVGLGVHPETMFGLFDASGINYKVSDY